MSPGALEDLCDRDADLVALDDNLAARDGLVIGHNQHCIVLPGVELNDGAAAHAQELMHGNDRTAENDRDLDLDAFDIGSHLPARDDGDKLRAFMLTRKLKRT